MSMHATHTDQELVQLLAQGERSAFEEIYTRYWPVLYNAAYKRLKNREMSEDVLQEVFARIWIKRERHQIHELSAYLQVAVYHECIKTITRAKDVTGFYQPFEEMLAAAHSPEEQLVARELMELVHDYAATLPKKRREILLKYVASHMTTKEIAAEMGVSTKTVQNQLRTGLNGLKSHLSIAILVIIEHHL